MAARGPGAPAGTDVLGGHGRLDGRRLQGDPGAVVTQHVLDEIRKVLHPRAVIITRVGRKADPRGPGAQGAGVPGHVHGDARRRDSDPRRAGTRPRDVAQRLAGRPVEHRAGSRRGGARGELRAHGRTRPDHPLRPDAVGEAGVLHAAGAAHPEHVDPHAPHAEASAHLAARASAGGSVAGRKRRPTR